MIENDEYFSLALTASSANARIADGWGQATIVNDDVFPPRKVGKKEAVWAAASNPGR